jgi:hypothetical protein
VAKLFDFLSILPSSDTSGLGCNLLLPKPGPILYDFLWFSKELPVVKSKLEVTLKDGKLPILFPPETKIPFF